MAEQRLPSPCAWKTSWQISAAGARGGRRQPGLTEPSPGWPPCRGLAHRDHISVHKSQTYAPHIRGSQAARLTPMAAFRMTGRPTASTKERASAARATACSVPGTTGTPHSSASCLALSLSPMACHQHAVVNSAALMIETVSQTQAATTRPSYSLNQGLVPWLWLV